MITIYTEKGYCPSWGRESPPTRQFDIQNVASSGAHLTEYCNLIDMSMGLGKLIVDEAIAAVGNDPTITEHESSRTSVGRE